MNNYNEIADRTLNHPKIKNEKGIDWEEWSEKCANISIPKNKLDYKYWKQDRVYWKNQTNAIFIKRNLTARLIVIHGKGLRLIEDQLTITTLCIQRIKKPIQAFNLSEETLDVLSEAVQNQVDFRSVQRMIGIMESAKDAFVGGITRLDVSKEIKNAALIAGGLINEDDLK